jgi:hypothetical protein
MIGLIIGASISIGAVIGFVWILCAAAAKPAPPIPYRPKPFPQRTPACYPQTCTRRAPHECAVNGPCNGFPKRGTYANGRPTMPSEVEPELERERRTR